jgi:hypothetical protein
MIKLSLLFVFIFPVALFAQSPTWAEHVAPIIYNNCVSCHHTGGLAPTSFINYLDVQAEGALIKTAVLSKSMPPWPPQASYNRLAHERLLSNADIILIETWVNNGMAQGNMALAPIPPTFNSNTQLGTISLSLTMPTYTSIASNFDEYRCFVMPTNLSIDNFATAIEAIPGNGNIVHHVLVYYDTSNTCIQLDNADPNPGYSAFGGVGSSTANLMSAWVPGSQPQFFPSGFGMRLPANAKIIFQIHYPAGSIGQKDSTTINFKLSLPGSLRELYMSSPLDHISSIQNGPLYIPANQTKTFYEKYTVPIGVSILNVAPHMHLVGQSIKVFATKPTGDTVKLINIPSWDFHWQGAYNFRNVIVLPANSNLWASAFYNNTTSNANNPNSPPQAVSLGEATTDEMMLVYFTYTFALPGDENIVIDNTPLVDITEPAFTSNLVLENKFSIFPNPCQNEINISWSNGNLNSNKLEVFNMEGKRMAIYKVSVNEKKMLLNLHGYRSGNYIIKIGNVSQTFAID